MHPTTRSLLEILHAHDGPGGCFPKISTLAAIMGLSEITIKRHIKTLATLKAIKKERLPTKKGRQNRYILDDTFLIPTPSPYKDVDCLKIKKRLYSLSTAQTLSASPFVPKKPKPRKPKPRKPFVSNPTIEKQEEALLEIFDYHGVPRPIRTVLRTIRKMVREYPDEDSAAILGKVSKVFTLTCTEYDWEGEGLDYSIFKAAYDSDYTRKPRQQRQHELALAMEERNEKIKQNAEREKESLVSVGDVVTDMQREERQKKNQSQPDTSYASDPDVDWFDTTAITVAKSIEERRATAKAGLASLKEAVGLAAGG